MTVRCVVWLAALSLLPVAHAAAEGTAPVLVTFAGDDAASLLGVWDTQRWLSPPQAVPKVKADTGYRVQGLTGPSVDAVGGSPVSYDGPCADFFSVNLTPKRVAKQTLIATRADLKARPRSVTALPTSGSVYLSVIKAELQKRGLSTPQLKLQQVIRADLDGDGKDEVLLEASFFKDSDAANPVPSPNAAAGDYSLLLLRSVVNGKTKTTVLGEDAVLKASNDIDAPRMNLRYSLEGVADLNGDGTMEIITSESYYEGFTLYAWTWTPAQGLRKVLQTGCGV
ncbi:hypothetical protein EHF33_12810 [Deinococcus psychrotolerans]|uniref:VCBS repeat-containing protein n=1 Tax=Deinococcus psychrotolerans TaxID=2489213 RepID=A0A3G8YH38_9DEIO|nr:hypothetical protein [Deinococcus psychrotolerans]AZI43517.1 hypothetical protein EHF33_12810 [Deinococcus psychrotolerans]